MISGLNLDRSNYSFIVAFNDFVKSNILTFVNYCVL